MSQLTESITAVKRYVRNMSALVYLRLVLNLGMLLEFRIPPDLYEWYQTDQPVFIAIFIALMAWSICTDIPEIKMSKLIKVIINCHVRPKIINSFIKVENLVTFYRLAEFWLNLILEFMAEFELIIKVTFVVIFTKKSTRNRKIQTGRKYRKTAVIGQFCFFTKLKEPENIDFFETTEIGRPIRRRKVKSSKASSSIRSDATEINALPAKEMSKGKLRC